MADSAERVRKHRAKQAERERHVAAAKKLVPFAGERQDRAVAYALWRVEAHAVGEVAHPY